MKKTSLSRTTAIIRENLRILLFICIFICTPALISALEQVNERELFAMEMFFQNEDIYGPARLQLSENDIEELNAFAVSALKIIARESENLNNDEAQEYIMQKIYSTNGLKDKIIEKVDSLIDKKKDKSELTGIKNIIPKHLLTKKNIVTAIALILFLILIFILLLKLIARTRHPLKILFTLILLILLALLIFIKKTDVDIFYNTRAFIEHTFFSKESGKNIFYVKALKNKEYAEELIKDIENAQNSIYISMYLIEINKNDNNLSNRIINALCEAADRNLKIFALLELPAKGANPDLQKKNNQVKKKLEKFKIVVKWDSPASENHEKAVLIDERILYIGNHNWSIASLEHNEELSFKIVSYRFDSGILNYFLDMFSETKADIQEFSDISLIQKELAANDTASNEITEPSKNPVVRINTDDMIKTSEFKFLTGYSYFFKLKKELLSAEKSVIINMFLVRYLNPNINDPVYNLLQILNELHQKGVKINVQLDKMLESENAIAFDYFKEKKIPVKFYEGSNIMHTKLVVIDGKKIFCGSHNWTNSAFNSNREISAYIENSELADSMHNIINY